MRDLANSPILALRFKIKLNPTIDNIVLSIFFINYISNYIYKFADRTCWKSRTHYVNIWNLSTTRFFKFHWITQLYLLQKIRCLHVDPTSSLYNMFGTILARTFRNNFTTEKNRYHFASWKTLLVSLKEQGEINTKFNKQIGSIRKG